MTQDHALPVTRACRCARLSRAAYYQPVADRGQKDAEVVAALNEIITVELRWFLEVL